MSEHKSTKVSRLPECDICKYVENVPKPNLAAYDAKTTTGQWGYLCEEHFTSHGISLGLGWGQKLELV